MFSASRFRQRLFSNNNENFEVLALTLFKHQYRTNTIYQQYVDTLGVRASEIHHARDIPFLPIQFFRTHQVCSGTFRPELVFESSGTTLSVPSRHYVRDASLYEESFLQGFRLFYGQPDDWVILGLLPSYLERQHSSLVHMVDRLIRESGQVESGFYLHDREALYRRLMALEETGRRTLLIGVTFALLDFADQYRMDLRHTVVMETGGMKGRREEWTKQQVRDRLRERLGVTELHAEYGMTELLSQAYAGSQGRYRCPPWMRVDLREENDPLAMLPVPVGGATSRGLINVTDLANMHSCAFIATEDIGQCYEDGSFEVLGRLDHSALRGCSLMV